MKHRLEQFPNGSFSVRPVPQSGAEKTQAMHSFIGPWEEAQQIYIRQSQLTDKLRSPLTNAPLVLYDIGMGIAANALAAIECFEATFNHHPHQTRPLHIISFENDLDGLRFALEHQTSFPFIARNEKRLQSLIQNHEVIFTFQWSTFHWTLISGDFLSVDLRALAPPELIFYDFYSPAIHPELWGYQAFEKLFSQARLVPSCELWTYCSSTAARAAMLLAGFYVGVGQPTAVKKETTWAGTTQLPNKKVLDSAWMEKLKRSSQPLPKDWPEGDLSRAIEIIQNHEQFKRLLLLTTS